MCFQFPERKEASSILTNTTASTSQSINASELYNLLTKIESTITSSKISLESVINNQVIIEQQKSEVLEQKTNDKHSQLNQKYQLQIEELKEKVNGLNSIITVQALDLEEVKIQKSNQIAEQATQINNLEEMLIQKDLEITQLLSQQSIYQYQRKPLIQERIQSYGQEDEIIMLRQCVQDQQLTIKNLNRRIKDLEQFNNILENKIKIEEIKNKELEEKIQQFNPTLRLSSGSRTARNVWQNKSALFPKIDKK